MVIKPKNIILPLALLILLWISWTTYNFVFDMSKPVISIYGLDANGYYSGDCQCIIRGSDSYKVSDISVWLDNKLIVNKFKINKKEFEHPLPIPTKSLPNGKHVLKIEAIDSSINKNKTLQEVIFYVDNTPLQAVFVHPDANYKVFQGRTFHLQFQVSKSIKEAKIKLLSKTYDCFQESKSSSIYECFVPIDCEESPNEYPFNVEIIDHTGNTLNLPGKFQIIPYPFKKHVKLNVDPERVKAQEENSLKQDLLEEEIEAAFKKSPKQKLWQGDFYVPMEISKVSCDFGTKRVTQEKGFYMHKAVDVVGVPKTVVWAPQDGIIISKNRYTRSGNTVVIDHGLGIFTLLFHLDKFANINVGDKVKRGNPVGTMGQTGYATGYHLHWEMRIFDGEKGIQIDPLQWTTCTF